MRTRRQPAGAATPAAAASAPAKRGRGGKATRGGRQKAQKDKENVATPEEVIDADAEVTHVTLPTLHFDTDTSDEEGTGETRKKRKEAKPAPKQQQAALPAQFHIPTAPQAPKEPTKQPAMDVEALLKAATSKRKRHFGKSIASLPPPEEDEVDDLTAPYVPAEPSTTSSSPAGRPDGAENRDEVVDLGDMESYFDLKRRTVQAVKKQMEGSQGSTSASQSRPPSSSLPKQEEAQDEEEEVMQTFLETDEYWQIRSDSEETEEDASPPDAATDGVPKGRGRPAGSVKLKHFAAPTAVRIKKRRSNTAELYGAAEEEKEEEAVLPIVEEAEEEKEPLTEADRQKRRRDQWLNLPTVNLPSLPSLTASTPRVKPQSPPLGAEAPAPNRSAAQVEYEAYYDSRKYAKIKVYLGAVYAENEVEEKAAQRFGPEKPACFRIRETDILQKVFDAYCEKCEIDPHYVGRDLILVHNTFEVPRQLCPVDKRWTDTVRLSIQSKVGFQTAKTQSKPTLVPPPAPVAPSAPQGISPVEEKKEDTKEASEEGAALIKIKFNYNGQVDYARVDKSHAISETMDWWRKKRSIEEGKTVKFVFDGDLLKAETQWCDTELEDEDMIEVRVS